MKSKTHLILTGAIALAAAAATPASAQSQSIQARISGGGGSGKCTVEVVVQGSADVQIRGNQGTLRTLSGNPAQWRRLDCNQPLPGNPSNFRFTGVDGHGRQGLSSDPNSNNGVAVIHIENTTGGNEGYTADITWGGGLNNSNGNWGTGPGNQNDNWNGQSQNIHARISGAGGSGKCTFEVAVSGSAELQIRGDQGNLRTLSGSPAQWRRLECNQPLPPQPGNLRFTGIDGHGRQSMDQNAATNSGTAVIRIENTTGGNEGYTGAITWNGGSNDNWGNGGTYNRGDGGDSWDVASANSGVQGCQDTITARLRHDHSHAKDIQLSQDAVRVSRRSNDLATIQGDGLYRSKNGNSRQFTYNCVYDVRSGQVTESAYR